MIVRVRLPVITPVVITSFIITFFVITVSIVKGFFVVTGILIVIAFFRAVRLSIKMVSSVGIGFSVIFLVWFIVLVFIIRIPVRIYVIVGIVIIMLSVIPAVSVSVPVQIIPVQVITVRCIPPIVIIHTGCKGKNAYTEDRKR